MIEFMYKALVNDVLAINKASNSNAGVSLWRHQIKIRWSDTDFHLAWVYLAYSNIKEAFKATPCPHLCSSDHFSVMLLPA